MAALLDTGFLLAVIDADDNFHAACAAALEAEPNPLLPDVVIEKSLRLAAAIFPPYFRVSLFLDDPIKLHCSFTVDAASAPASLAAKLY